MFAWEAHCLCRCNHIIYALYVLQLAQTNRTWFISFGALYRGSILTRKRRRNFDRTCGWSRGHWRRGISRRWFQHLLYDDANGLSFYFWWMHRKLMLIAYAEANFRYDIGAFFTLFFKLLIHQNKGQFWVSAVVLCNRPISTTRRRHLSGN